MDINKVWHYSRYQHLLTLASLTRPVRTQLFALSCRALHTVGTKELFEAAQSMCPKMESTSIRSVKRQKHAI